MIFGSRRSKATDKSENPAPLQAQGDPEQEVTGQHAQDHDSELAAVGQATPQQAVSERPVSGTAAQVAEVRARLQETFGKVVLAAMSVPRYRNLAISELNALFLDPLMRDRIAVATMSKDGDTAASTLTGIAIWASVSEEVDVKIREQIRAGTFPVRLQPDDWNSGAINWLFDVIAPTQELTANVIANFRQVVQGGSMRIHPMVSRLVDPETLEKMGARRVSNPNPDARQ